MSRQILASRPARDKFPTRISLAFGLVTLVLLIAQRFAFIKTEVDVPMGWPQDPFRNRSLLFLILERGVLPGWGLHLILFVVGGVFFPRRKWILWLVLLLWFLVVWLALLAHVPVYSWWYRARIARGIDPDNDPTENGNLKKFLGFSIAALVLAVAELVFACVDQHARQPILDDEALKATFPRRLLAEALELEATEDLKPDTEATEGTYEEWMREGQKRRWRRKPKEPGPDQRRNTNKGKGKAVDNGAKGGEYEGKRKNPKNVLFTPGFLSGRLSTVVEGGTISERGTLGRRDLSEGYFG